MASWKIKKPRMNEISLLVLSIMFLVFCFYNGYGDFMVLNMTKTIFCSSSFVHTMLSTQIKTQRIIHETHINREQIS